MRFLYLPYSRFLRISRNVTLLLFFSWGQMVAAIEESTLTLERALQLTLQNNPVLQAYPLMIRGAEAMTLQSGLSPNPLLNVEIENTLGTGNYQNFDSAEFTLAISQVIELGEKRENSRRFANAKTQSLKSEYDLSRLDVVAETTRRFYHVLLLQAKLALLDERHKKEFNALKTIRHRAKASAVGQADVAKMSLRVARSELRRNQLNNSLALTKMRLASMWMGETASSRLMGNLSQMPEVLKENQIAQFLLELPTIKHQLALQRMSDSRLALEQAKGTSNITLGVGLRQHQTTSDQSINFSFSMPIAFENPNKGRIEAARANQALSTQKTAWTRQQLKLNLMEIRQQLLSYQSEAKYLQTNLLPQANSLLTETRRGYQKGRYSVLQWVDAQSELFSIEESIIDLEYKFHLSLLELERITGRSMLNNTPAIKKLSNDGDKS